MEYIISEKPAFSFAGILRRIGSIVHKNKGVDLRSYVGYVTIPGINNGQKIFINKGFFTADKDLFR